MSLASHDSAKKCHDGVTNEPKVDTGDNTKLQEKTTEKESFIEHINKTPDIKNINKKTVVEKTATKVTEIVDADLILLNEWNYSSKENVEIQNKVERNLVNNKNYISKSTDKASNKFENKENDFPEKAVFRNNFDVASLKRNYNHDCKRNNEKTTTHINKTKSDANVKNKTWQKQNKNSILKDNVCNVVKRRINENCKSKAKWKSNAGVLLSLVMLNVAGLGNAVDTSSFSSALTSRMIATFLGYPSTCNLGAEVPCTLTFSCWLQGGTRLRSCGGWLFSCCGMPETRDTFDNSIPSSEWKYKPPTKLRQVPQRNIVPNNVFRRRVDDDVTQMECGLPSSKILQKRIIGGREARFAEFPWQAHVRISEFQCGGVLVSHRYVATAAHCVSRAHTRDIVVWLGAIDTSATHHPARKLGVIQKILHPLFQYRMTQPDRYDIALLKLSRPVPYMSHILPICLPDTELELRGRSGVIAGWGKTDASSGHTGTNLLRSATVPILSKEQCINWHQSKQISVEIHSEMICAGHSDGHQDACLGDSGGPLIVLDSGRYYLVGITSAGFGCGVDHQPGIYHNVKLTANWIRNVISPVSYNDNYIN